MKPEALAVRSLFALAAAAALGAACVTTETYVYTAQKYDAANACVEDYRAIEVIDGKGAKSTCPASCLLVNGELFVSTMCPPLPAVAAAVALDAADCKAAIGAPSCSAQEPGDGGEDEAGDAEPDGTIRDGAPGDTSASDTGADATDASDAG
ncbi:MAG: hypothetical protein JST00_36775 [Deltaproteobacteria bacterium]|nr:hypothetical protein [Deltaproteobacteria bacterium]